jgi:hypothetical protein
MRRTRTVPLPPIRLRADVAPSATGKRRAQATIYTGAEMERFDVFDGHYTLRLAMDGADLSRFNSGAPVTRNHSRDVDDVVGTTERAWLSGGAYHATLRLSDREGVAALWADIQSGVVKNVSMDVALLELEDSSKSASRKALLATKWQPIGLAIVTAGADPGAQMAALADAERRPCRLTFPDDGGSIVNDDTTTDDDRDDAGAETPKTREQLRAELREAKRRERIRELAAHFELGDVWAQRHLELGSSIEDAKRDGMRLAAKRSPEIDGRLTVGNDFDSIGFKLEAMSDALAARGRGVAPSERGRRYAHASIVECAFELLRARGLTGGLDPRWNAGRVVELALTSSDFPSLLANVLNKQLQPAYMAATPVFRAIGRERQFNDYRPHSMVRVGDFPPMLQVGEAGEITEGAIGDSGETVTALAYGRIVHLNRRVLVDDDAGAFSDLTMAAGRRVADVQNTLFMNACILPNSGLGPVLADGVQLHNASHGNVAANGALDVTHIGECRSLMMRQRGLESDAGKADGVYLNNQPKYLLTSPVSLTLAEQLTTQIQPVVVEEVNPFSSRLIPLGDANLGTSARYYLIADPAVLATFIYGSIGGEGPRVAVREGFETEGVSVRIAFDFAAGAVDWRGTTTGNGA